jgi:hypothetical protein
LAIGNRGVLYKKKIAKAHSVKQSSNYSNTISLIGQMTSWDLTHLMLQTCTSHLQQKQPDFVTREADLMHSTQMQSKRNVGAHVLSLQLK